MLESNFGRVFTAVHPDESAVVQQGVVVLSVRAQLHLLHFWHEGAKRVVEVQRFGRQRRNGKERVVVQNGDEPGGESAHLELVVRPLVLFRMEVVVAQLVSEEQLRFFSLFDFLVVVSFVKREVCLLLCYYQ